MLFSEYLVNEGLPQEYRIKGTVDKKSLTTLLTRIAKEKPSEYPEIVKHIKKVGDMLATYEGISVGLDDVTPDYAKRDKIIQAAQRDISKLKTEDAILNRIVKAQVDGLDAVKGHGSALRRQVDSGSRGKPAQFMKTVFSPVAAKGPGDKPVPYLITKSYSEGLTPGEFWVTAGESRRELTMTQLATALPGDSSKQINSTLAGALITKPDCKTKNGIEYNIDDHHLLNRYEAGTDTLLTDAYIRSLKAKKKKTVRVRSPLTCLEHPGCCQKCFGLNQEGQHHALGTNIGLRAAQSLSEPLTQMVLSTKHGGQVARTDDYKLKGALGFRQLLGIPEIFKNEAVLSQVEGKVDWIRPSPQGGVEISVGGTVHYVSPKRKTLVKVGQRVLKGQQLSDGVPNPQQVVSYRGLGPGRQYLTETLFDIYKDSGVDIDKRHVELLVKQDLNHVKVTKTDPKAKFIRGDVIQYNQVRDFLGQGAKDTPLTDKVIGKKLGKEVSFYTAGTVITKEIFDALKSNGVKTVSLTTKKMGYEPLMRPLEQIPLLGSDWVARLGHRRLKDTIMRGAAEGWESSLKGTSPYAPLVYNDQNFAKDIDKGHY